MHKTDYSKIADRYDNNPIRHEIPKDELIGDISFKTQEKINVLDLCCGTGIYLKKQMEYYVDRDIYWYGLDQSEEMLKKAVEKNPDANLVHGDAMCLPFDENSFDYVKLRFAIHHFPDKQKGISEINRILKPGGILSLFNLCHDYMKRSWVYEYFPSTIMIDEQRFPETIGLFGMLSDNGFSVNADINVIIKNYTFEEMICEVENRDMSQLTMISEDDYTSGLARMKKDALSHSYFTGDIALIDFTCMKL